MANTEYAAVFSRRAAKARNYAIDFGDGVPENIQKALVDTAVVEELTPEDVPQFLLDWVERLEEESRKRQLEVSQLEPKYSLSERKHKTVFTLTSHDYVSGKTTTSEIDLSKLSDEELDDYLFQIPEATSEIVYRELQARISNKNQ
jgi:hypothetical protein